MYKQHCPFHNEMGRTMIGLRVKSLRVVRCALLCLFCNSSGVSGSSGRVSGSSSRVGSNSFFFDNCGLFYNNCRVSGVFSSFFFTGARYESYSSYSNECKKYFFHNF